MNKISLFFLYSERRWFFWGVGGAGSGVVLNDSKALERPQSSYIIQNFK